MYFRTKEAQRERKMPVPNDPAVLNDQLHIRYARYREVLKNLTMMSDIFMRNVFKQKECTEIVLQVIMQKKGLKIREQIVQRDYKNLQGRSAVLDCVALDTAGTQFDIEIQQENEGASPRRARYHSGLLDMNTLNTGENFDLLPESHVIFITRNDILGYNLPIYHITRKIAEVENEFTDGTHILYVNSSRQDDTELGRLMHDFHCKSASDMHNPVLAKRVYELKETTEGVEIMCKEMEQIYSEGKRQGEAQGRSQGIAEGLAAGEMKVRKETALALAERGMTVTDIADIVKVSVRLVQEWLSGNIGLA